MASFNILPLATSQAVCGSYSDQALPLPLPEGNSFKVPSWQHALLARCVRQEIPLDEALSKAGHNYEELRYAINRPVGPFREKVLTLEGLQQTQIDIPVVSFFSGAGGLDLGFEAAGFRHLASFEHNQLFCDTLRSNRPNWNVIGPPNADGDISKTEKIDAALKGLGVSKKFDGIFIGGPPCQPFSIAANQRFSRESGLFKRVGYAHSTNGNLLSRYVSLICRFQPRVFLIENVTGLIDLDGGKQLKSIIARLAKAGYNVEDPKVLDAVRYGIPQHRVRLFLIGFRGKGELGQLRPISSLVPCSVVFKKPIEGLANNETRHHRAESIMRYMMLDYGKRDQLGRCDRLNPNKSSKTVIAGGTGGGGRSHLHPYIPRTLSVRECARLQTFPDDYVFQGPSARQFTQVGNAVPPVLAAQLAGAIRRGLLK